MNAPALRSYEDLPGPRGLPLLGNALQLKGARMHLQMEQWCREFGPYYRLKVGPRRLLVVGEHQAVATMLRDRPEGFSRGSRLEAIGQEMGLKPGLFGVNGDMWRRQRRMVMAAFDPAHVRHYFPALRTVGARLVGRWRRAASEGRAINLQADLMRYTVDTIAGLAFGAEVNTLESDEDVIQKHLDKIFPALARRLSAPLPMWRWFPSEEDRELKRSMLAVNEAVDAFIAQARARLKQDSQRAQHPQNLLEAMIVAADAPDSGIDDAQVAGNVLTMLLAGEDTTANTIAWMIWLLWRHPEALSRAAEEVRRVLVDPANPTHEQLNRLEYVEACAHETMRLKPVAPLLVLQPLHETTIGPVRVPPNVAVFCLMRRDSVSDDYLPEAAKFRPERWLTGVGPGQSAGAAKRVSMPFGAGPRICPGRYLALLEMKMAMAMLLSHFEIAGVDTPDGSEARERLSFTMTPVDLRLRLKGL
ncbi:MAG TPA: cytochrome P450 [Burkholderiales bacterium]|nr:cytochrome P450 [Burkholderiales bacterium]